MKKKMISMVLALTLTLGSAAALPQSVFTDNACITAAAETEGLFEYNSYELYSEVTKYNGKSTNVVIPDTLGGKPVCKIAKYAFMNNENIETVKIPSNVFNIGGQAFAGCSNLKTIKDFNLTRISGIDNAAFYDCKSLELNYSDFPTTLVSVGDLAFYNCEKIEGVNLTNVTTIGGGAFERCSSLTSISAPKTTNYGASVFRDCINLQNITLSNDIQILSNRMFQGCENLVFSIPRTVKSIGDYCFENCDNFTNIVVPAGCTHIGEYALGVQYFKYETFFSKVEGYEKTTDNLYCYQKSKAVTEEYATMGRKNGMLFSVIVIDCNHKYEDTVTKPATCTENGEMTHICTECLDSYTTEIPAKGHNWGEWKITTPATKEAHGIETRTCLDCDAEETRTVAYSEDDEYLLGDVNGDGKINVTDISKAAAHVKGKKLLSGDELARADINSDGIVNISDITRIAAHVKGKKSITPRVRSSIK